MNISCIDFELKIHKTNSVYMQYFFGAGILNLMEHLLFSIILFCCIRVCLE